MPKDPKDGKAVKKDSKEPEPASAEAAVDPAADAAGKPRTAIDDVIAAIEAARDKVMADEVKGLVKLGIPRAMAYQMVAARFHQNVVTDTETGTPEFDGSTWSDR